MLTDCVEVLEWDAEKKENSVHVYSVGARFTFSQPNDPLGVSNYTAYDYEGGSYTPDDSLKDGQRYEVVEHEQEDGTNRILLREVD